MDAFLREHGARDHPAMAVSLSGGVDSMVIAKLLTALSPTHGGFRVAACHIDYANRPESGAEAEFVLDWCVGPRAVASTPGAVHMIRAFASYDWAAVVCVCGNTGRLHNAPHYRRVGWCEVRSRPLHADGGIERLRAGV